MLLPGQIVPPALGRMWRAQAGPWPDRELFPVAWREPCEQGRNRGSGWCGMHFRAYTFCNSKRPRPKLGVARFSQHSAHICPNVHFKGWGVTSKSAELSPDCSLVGFPPEIAFLRQSYSIAASSAQGFFLEAGRSWQDTMPP